MLHCRNTLFISLLFVHWKIDFLSPFSIANELIQWVNAALYDILPRLMPILKKDSYRRFLRLFDQDGRDMGWGYVITLETFDQIIVQNALRCAKVALKGQAPELDRFCANPNYVN